MTGSHPDVAIVSAGHDVADARLHKIVAALCRRGMTVTVTGLGDASLGPAGAGVRTTQRRSMIGRAARAATLPWQSSACVLLTVDPDVVPMARVAAVVRRRKVVVDVHEDYARLLADRSWAHGIVGIGARILVQASTKLAAGADVTVVADDHIPPRLARRRLVVENAPAVEMLSPGPPDPTPRAIYVGDLRTSRGLFDMIDAVADAPSWSLDLVGPVAAGDVGRLDARLQEADVAGRVVLHGRKPPAQAWQIARGAWVGLVFLRETPAFREAMPTKLYEYLASGLPVLSTRLPRQSAALAESGGGVLIDTPAEAAKVLRGWADRPGDLDTYRTAARTWADRTFAGRTPFDELADVILELLASSRATD